MNHPFHESGAPSVFWWILITGGIGFAAGFFGPIALNPEANQGPLVGIFISGPVGAFLGLVLYLLSRPLHFSAARQWQVLWASGAILAVVTLSFCLPGPVFRGFLLDAQIQGCKPPEQVADDAIAYWEKRVAGVTWAAPRAGWQDDARHRLHEDQAVALEVMVVRKLGIYESRKPWDKGGISARGWYPENEQKSYYAQYAGGACEDYPLGSRSVRFVSYNPPGMAGNAENWPPRELPSFLNLLSLGPVPAEYQKLVGK